MEGETKDRKEEQPSLRHVIVIGASAGGIPAIKQIVMGLTGEIDAAVVIVLHVSSKSNSTQIANIFQNITTLTCAEASNGIKLQKGHLYVAPPQQQLMLKPHNLILKKGTDEDKYRPSIDVLFSSAAADFEHRVIGIILTGLFEDGTAGMQAIKQSGGICIIQDPKEALFPDMPLSVRNKIEVDYEARLDEIPNILKEIVSNGLKSGQ